MRPSIIDLTRGLDQYRQLLGKVYASSVARIVCFIRSTNIAFHVGISRAIAINIDHPRSLIDIFHPRT